MFPIYGIKCTAPMNFNNEINNYTSQGIAVSA